MAKNEPRVNVSLLSPREQEEYKKLKERTDKEKAEESLKKLQEKYKLPDRNEQISKKISQYTSKSFKPVERLAKPSPTIKSVKFRQPTLTKQQMFMRSFLGGGERTFGTGENLPVINGALTTGFGLIKHPLQRETGHLFGF